MKVSVANSGSDGNGYAVKTSTGILLIEAGVPAKEMLQTIEYKTADVNGCIVSHMHRDHAKYIASYLKYGFPIFMTPESMGDTPVPEIYRHKQNQIGKYTVVPFRVPHNETACDGFLISHKEFGKLLFVTDAEMCTFNMSKVGINHVMVECNYSLDYLDVTEVNKDHILQGHMELQTCKKFLRTIYTDHLKSIGLIHLSHVNADPVRFQKEIAEEFPRCKVWVAEKNKTIVL